MFKQDIIGELLYRGFVIEKGRCYQKVWKIGYKKILKTHIMILSEIFNSLWDEKVGMNELMDRFYEVCCKDLEIGKYYNISNQFWFQVKNRMVNWEDRIYQYDKTNRLMELLIQELFNEINVLIVNKKKIYIVFRILHNLPRIYLGKNKDSVLNLYNMGISEDDAIQFAILNMDLFHKLKYEEFLV